MMVCVLILRKLGCKVVFLTIFLSIAVKVVAMLRGLFFGVYAAVKLDCLSKVFHPLLKVFHPRFIHTCSHNTPHTHTNKHTHAHTRAHMHTHAYMCMQINICVLFQVVPS